MNQGDVDSSFLAAGVQHFPDAHATVSAFRRLIEEKVDEILKSSRPEMWKPKEVKATKGEATGLWVGAGGPMLLQSLPGKAIVIDVGIKWNSKELKEPKAALAVIYSVTAVLGRPLEWSSDNDVRLVRVANRDVFVAALVDATANVVDAFNRVVDAAADAVAATIDAIEAPAVPPIPPA